MLAKYNIFINIYMINLLIMISGALYNTEIGNCELNKTKRYLLAKNIEQIIKKLLLRKYKDDVEEY